MEFRLRGLLKDTIVASPTMRPMPEVSAHVAPPLVLPFALWTQAGDAPSAAHEAVLPPPELPHFQAWLRRATCVSRQSLGSLASPSLSMPHECAQALTLGWTSTSVGSFADGLLPWAAVTAVQRGLAKTGDGSAWGFVSLCHWQISHGSATLTDPADLALDDATDAALFQAMQGFFAEDGLLLHRDQPGRWLVQSPGLAQLPTASLDRVIGEDVDAWLVGQQGASVDAGQVKLWRRLQNEMQMLLYMHPVNAQRQVPINSFWLHGTGAAPMRCEPLPEVDPQVQTTLQALRRAHLARHVTAWCEAWQQLDDGVHRSGGYPQAVVLCGAHQMHRYELGAAESSGLRRLWQWLGGTARNTRLSQVLIESTNERLS
jgi:hypothetical protein